MVGHKLNKPIGHTTLLRHWNNVIYVVSMSQQRRGLVGIWVMFTHVWVTIAGHNSKWVKVQNNLAGIGLTQLTINFQYNI